VGSLVSITITRVAVFQIDDPGDPRIADYRNIPDSALLERQQVFVAEGRLVVRRLLASKRLVTRSVMVTAPAFAALSHEIAHHIPVFLASQSVMNSVTGFDIHRGCLAIGERREPPDWRSVTASARHLVVLERIGNPDNIGAIFRNASAFGIDGVLLGPGCADPLYRKAIRTSMAASLTVPFGSLAHWPEAIHALRADGFHVLGMSPCTGARPLRDVVSSLPPDARVAVLAGHEGDGLTPDAIDACESLARIPMAAGHDSLNVATALAIALYELGW
jgi:tRNA G18 (ribose-2'-O)-methylase SpoU